MAFRSQLGRGGCRRPIAVTICESVSAISLWISSMPLRLYSIYNRLLYYLFPYEQAILVFNAIIVNSCFGYFIYKRSEHPVFSSVCYLLLYTYMNTFNGTRQYIACGLFLVGIIFAGEKDGSCRSLDDCGAGSAPDGVCHAADCPFCPDAEMDEGKIPFWGAGIILEVVWFFPLLSSADSASGGKDAASLPKVCRRTDSLL